MDLASFTTDDLLAALPIDGEDDRWEVKSAVLLEPSKRGEFKRELGKQVSAFANSGGGYLVFGISDDGKPEPCEAAVGRQPMKDFLATMVEQSVESPIRHFKVHRIPFTSDPDKSIFVVAIEDSPAAPHHAKDERNYFYRIDGHSKPAPHFHVELLRNRMTKAVLQINEIEYGIRSLNRNSPHATVDVVLDIEVENVSFQSATDWGIHIKQVRGHNDWRWKLDGHTSGYLSNGTCIHGDRTSFLPGEKKLLTVCIAAAAQDNQDDSLVAMWRDLGVMLRPVSNNYVGEETLFGCQDRNNWLQEVPRGNEFRNRLARFAGTA
jgi:hypothetical protein